MLRRIGALAVAFSLVACAGPADHDEGGNPPSSSSAPAPSVTASSESTRLSAALVEDLEAVATDHPDAEVAVALAPVGRDERPQVVGDAPALVAWSTIKVPLALAALRAADRPADVAADVDAALTASDNDAAQRLWETVGTGREASDAVEAELRRGGDDRTAVPAVVTAPGFSAFGQARWRLRDQATFTAALPCLPGTAGVIDAMGRVIGGQAWGLGGIDGALIKGGWGSTPDGYVVRQLGLLPGAKGDTAAVVQVRTGTHGQGVAVMDEVASVLDRHASRLPVGTCA